MIESITCSCLLFSLASAFEVLDESVPRFQATNSPCPIKDDTIAAVYSDISGGVGNGSMYWEHNFWSWWAASDSGVKWVPLKKHHVSGVPRSQECDLSSFPNLRLYVQPGGDAYDQQKGVRAHGRDNINKFIDSRPEAKYMGTCAGWYFASTSYYWEGSFYEYPAEPALLNRFPVVEGSITTIADYMKYPCYNVTSLSNALQAVYYGGPTRGWRDTPSALPPGFKTIMSFSEIPGSLTAGVMDKDMLLWSVHLEAYEGTFDKFDGRPVTISGLGDANQLANYRFRAETINSLLGTNFKIP